MNRHLDILAIHILNKLLRAIMRSGDMSIVIIIIVIIQTKNKLYAGHNFDANIQLSGAL